MPDFDAFPKPTRFQADPDALDLAASLLVDAQRPVVLADFLGRSEAAASGLVRLAELLSSPSSPAATSTTSRRAIR